MKRNTVIAAIILLISLTLTACASERTGGDSISTPSFFSDIGKTFAEIKNEHPDGEFMVRLDGFPDHAAACFGVPGEEYVSFFFGGHSGDFERAMNDCDVQLKCAGFITTAEVLFADMEDDMSFDDFFSLIGVEDHEYFGEDTITAQGWLSFGYHGMDVMLNATESAAAGAELVSRSAPVSIVDRGAVTGQSGPR